jgi:hypothetical protein
MQKLSPAVYSHWAAHNLNLVTNEACLIIPIRNCMTVVINRFLKMISSLLLQQAQVSGHFHIISH